MVEVLALYGSPGSGKSTQARALWEALRASGLAAGLIDIDELTLVVPYPGRMFAFDNLAAVWPNYAAVPDIRVVIPTVFADEGEVGHLLAAMPGAALTVCELTAPIDVLKARVTGRERSEEWRRRLRDFVDLYHSRDDHARIRDFEVSTHPATVAETTAEILQRLGWDEGRMSGPHAGPGDTPRAAVG